MDKQQIVECLSEILGETIEAVTPANFAEKRKVIDENIFPSAKALGIDVNDILTEYQVELIQSSGGPNHPSPGRLYYIKGHLQELLEKVKKYDA